jgi:hypothetical protein
VQNPCQDEHGNIFRYTIEEPCSITTPYNTSNEPADHCHTQGSGEVTPTSSKEVPSDVAVHSAKEGGKKRCKQHPQGSMTTIDHDDNDYGKAGASDVGRVMNATDSDKRQARPRTDHFRRLIDEACLKHTYPVRHKLKECDIMKSFMILRSFT